jgi:hypothetical protein
MALTEETIQDKIEIVGDYKHVQVRTAIVIKRDGVEISRAFSRHVVAPDADTSGESAEVQAICAAVLTLGHLRLMSVTNRKISIWIVSRQSTTALLLPAVALLTLKATHYLSQHTALRL